MKPQLKFVVIFLFITSCGKKDNRIDIEDIMKNIETGTDSTYKREYFPNPNKSLYATLSRNYCAKIKTFVYYFDQDKNNVREIRTYMANRKYGHSFEFYPSGNLEQYCYFTGNENKSSYIKKYDIKGNTTEDLGNPFVDYLSFREGKLELHFSSVFSDSLQVEISSVNMPWKNLKLEKSAMLPMLLKGDIESVIDSIYFLKISSITNEKTSRKIYLDTLVVNNN